MLPITHYTLHITEWLRRLVYDGMKINPGYRLDLLVENSVTVELKGM
ncbi:hypothetical protein DRN76_02280 [Methanosarcinales archaeon]|nr:MAG: hypothetical protein DRN76_02280 [Methanosarcinales archaeon]